MACSLFFQLCEAHDTKCQLLSVPALILSSSGRNESKYCLVYICFLKALSDCIIYILYFCRDASGGVAIHVGGAADGGGAVVGGAVVGSLVVLYVVSVQPMEEVQQ